MGINGRKRDGDCVSTNLLLKETHNLPRKIEQFWATKSYGTDSKGNISLKFLQEQKALKHLKNTVECESNRYKVGNLWKKNQPSLPFDRPLALSRFSSLEKKFERNHEFSNKYQETINDYINKSYAVKLTQEKSKNVRSTTNYVPQHGIVNINNQEK